VLSMLCGGVSVRATSRLTDTAIPTILDLLLVVGEQCRAFLEERLQNLPVDDIQVDEVWQFVYAKEKQAYVIRDNQFVGYKAFIGDTWTYTAVDRHTKLVVAWHFGSRKMHDTNAFCQKLARATTGRFHLSTDGYDNYRTAVPLNLGNRVDYGMLVKIFGKTRPEDQRQYSPPKIVGTRKEAILGNPDEKRVCTSHTERNNGSIRCFIKRMGRLTYCFSKKARNHEAALTLHFAHFNFCRVHRTLKGTPAMAAKLADHPWTMAELLEAVSKS
jgi:IS1 family transposase